jgi:hypothetical protein
MYPSAADYFIEELGLTHLEIVPQTLIQRWEEWTEADVEGGEDESFEREGASENQDGWSEGDADKSVDSSDDDGDSGDGNDDDDDEAMPMMTAKAPRSAPTTVAISVVPANPTIWTMSMTRKTVATTAMMMREPPHLQPQTHWAR